MKSITIQFPDSDDAAISDILRACANALLDPNLEDRELMDGSYRVDTAYGPAFMRPVDEYDISDKQGTL